MSIEAIAWAYTVNAPSRERNVLFALAVFANGENIARPGIPNLEEATKMDGRAIQFALDRLIKLGFIERVEKGHKGYATTYRLRVINLTSYDVQSERLITPLIDRLIKLINGMINLSPYPVQDDKSITQSETADEFEAMKNLVEEMTGYPIPNNGQEIAAIDELIKADASRDDFAAALAFLKGKKVARGACDLLPSVRYNIAKRTQSKNGNDAYSKRQKSDVHIGDL